MVSTTISELYIINKCEIGNSIFPSIVSDSSSLGKEIKQVTQQISKLKVSTPPSAKK